MKNALICAVGTVLATAMVLTGWQQNHTYQELDPDQLIIMWSDNIKDLKPGQCVRFVDGGHIWNLEVIDCDEQSIQDIGPTISAVFILWDLGNLARYESYYQLDEKQKLDVVKERAELRKKLRRILEENPQS